MLAWIGGAVLPACHHGGQTPASTTAAPSASAKATRAATATNETEDRGQRQASSTSDSRPPGPSSPRLGVSWPAFHPGDYDDANGKVARFRKAGFESVTLVPTWAYVGLDRIDFSTGPSMDAVGNAMAAVLAADLELVIKPHLDPLRYEPGFEAQNADNRSWRADCPWRGYFDADPMSSAYLEEMLLPLVDELEGALREADGGQARRPVRLELGSELMNSTVYQPGRWAQLGERMRQERARRGLDGTLRLSHNVSHHFLLPEDFVKRMSEPARHALAAYIRGLDDLALSQYMDLEAAMPAQARGERLPTAAEVAAALRQHERTWRERILAELLGIDRAAQPTLHIGEFGIGVGGLSHPNVWAHTMPEDAEALAEEVARGHEGLARYLADADNRIATATLWVSGPGYDIFGWLEEAWANDRAVQAYANRGEAP
jgi:hypothetical protein